MKILFIINLLLSIGFFIVISGAVSMIAFNGHDDQLTFTCFVLHSVNGFLLIARALLK